MKKLTLNILLLIFLLTAAVVSASWLGLCADNGISYLKEDPNKHESESVFINSSIGRINEDSNKPELECM